MTPAERRRLAIIQDLAVRLLDAERLGDVLESGITSAIEQLGFGECVIYLWSEQRQRLEPSAGWSRTVETTDFLAGCRTIEANEGVAGRAFRTRRPELINETRNEPAYIQDRLEGRSELCVPLNHGDQCFGVIDSENLEPGHFTAEHRDLLILVASIIAPKIHNLQTIERLERLRGALEQSRSFVREMIDTAPNVLYVLDYDQRIMIEGMDRFAAFLGHARETIEALPEGVYSLIHPDDRDAVAQQEAELREASEGSVIAVEFRLRHADDGYRWCLVSSRIFQRRDDGSPILELGSVTDITSLKDALAREERREKRFRALFENCFDCIVLYDAQGTCRYSTPSVRRFTGYADHEIVGRNALDFVVQEDHAHSLKAWFELLQRPGGFAVLEQRIRNKDGRDIWIEARLTNRLDDPDVAGIVSNFHAIDERKVAEERINQLANFDSLTGLPNRRLLQETLEQRLEQARSGGTGLTLLYMDLDRFKNVNDTLGHDVGDRLLVRVASAAAAIVGDGRMIARLGGDEFAVLIEGETLEATTAVAGELVAAMEQPMHVDGYEVRLSASVGLARFPQHGQHADELFKHADIAMYRAKGERNRFAVFRAEDARAMRERVQVEKALQEAIDRQQFRLLYQPRVCLRTGRTVGVEALIRWDHPDRGTVPPDQFIPVAEETGLIYQIGEWVLNAACEQAARWRDRSFDLRVSINLSAHEMARSDIIEQVARALHTHGLDGPELELELTESAAMADLDEGLATLAQLRSQGVALSIDDFGTGHSSLSYLRRLPVDYLKIDQLFLPAQDAYAGTAGSALISGIILLAKSGGLRAVSEGVETRQQHHLLCQLGCDEAQGFYYAHPLPAEAIDELMTNGRSLVHASPPRA